MIKSAVGRHARVQMVAGPWAPDQHAPAPSMSVLSAPQVAPLLHQPRPSQAATPYQQAIQLPGKSTGRGVTVESPLTELPPQLDKPFKTVGGSRPEDRVTEASLPAAPGCMRDNIKCSPQLPPRKSLCLNKAAAPRPPAMTLCCWQQNSTAAGGRKTLSMCSRSTISTTYKPHSGRLNGQE